MIISESVALFDFYISTFAVFRRSEMHAPGADGMGLPNDEPRDVDTQGTGEFYDAPWTYSLSLALWIYRYIDIKSYQNSFLQWKNDLKSKTIQPTK